MMSKKDGIRVRGAGIGYVSVMIIFAMVCLAVFAVMSIRAAQSGEAVNMRAGEYTKQYYQAELELNETLARLDECALSAGGSEFFADSFAECAADIDSVVITVEGGDVRVIISAEITDRQSLIMTVVFYANPEMHGGARYEQKSLATATNGAEESGGLNVWDGSGIPA